MFITDLFMSDPPFLVDEHISLHGDTLYRSVAGRLKLLRDLIIPNYTSQVEKMSNLKVDFGRNAS